MSQILQQVVLPLYVDIYQFAYLIYHLYQRFLGVYHVFCLKRMTEKRARYRPNTVML